MSELERKRKKLSENQQQQRKKSYTNLANGK